MFFLFNIIIMIVLGIVEEIVGSPGVIGGLYSLAILVPGIAVGIRRLHDTDRSGWWFLIVFVPFIGGLVLLVFMLLGGTQGDNQFGPDPKGATA